MEGLDMKKLIPVFLAFVLLCGCHSYTAYKDYYTDTADYPEIWTLSGFYRGQEERSPIFPDRLNDLTVISFFCRYDQQLPLGEGVQLLLEIQYPDKQAFTAEVDRITALTVPCPDAFGGLEAHALRLGVDLTSEYCLINRAEQTIYYVYLKNIPKEQVEFDQRYIPRGYSGYGETEPKGENQ